MTPSKHYSSCLWCAKQIAVTGRGRKKKYCSQACRQRAYEQRNNLANTSIPVEAVIITPERAAQLRDFLFELRCAAEDISTAVGEDASKEEVQQLCDELVGLAKKIEKLRS